MEYTHEKTTENHLEDWKKFLNEEEKLEFNSELEDYSWYTILDENGEVIAIFEIINVVNSHHKCTTKFN
ncbi:MAG: hypothetical protein Ctma_1503 [Catillopecten margaritatus gill symbiont]|uniref:GNAT family N-acetyltransferase n=1 Tax=Catillopecten margaritatus gill symbiont TaxID=3083288 RepID=A0AAU6PIE1_9GAMM